MRIARNNLGPEEETSGHFHTHLEKERGENARSCKEGGGGGRADCNLPTIAKCNCDHDHDGERAGFRKFAPAICRYNIGEHLLPIGTCIHAP